MYLELDKAVTSSKNPMFIDCDNLLRRTYSVSPDDCVKTFFYTVKNHIRQISPDLVVAVVDGGHCPVRTKAYPEYKAKGQTRTEEEIQDYREKKNSLMNILSYLPVWTVDARTEADDIIAHLIRRCGFEGVPKAWIISTDKDFAQLIGRTSCDVQLVRKNQIINIDNIYQELGYERGIDFLQMRLLAGDSSDNIKGAKGIGEKRANEIIHVCNLSGNTFPKRVMSKTDSKWDDRKEEFNEAMGLSRLLMDLFRVGVMAYTRGQLETGTFTGIDYDRDKVKELLKEYKLYEFSTDYLNFIKPYLGLRR